MFRSMRWVVAVTLWGLASSARATGACDGDCDGDGIISVNELVKGVNIALGTLDVSGCMNFDANHDMKVTVEELVTAVNGALNGCAYLGEFYGTAALSGGRTAIFNFASQADGTVSGTLTVRDATGGSSFLSDARGGVAVVISVGSYSGSIDLDTGAFAVDGSIILNGVTIPIHVSGQFPAVGGSSESFSGSVGDESFSGSVVSGDGSTPTPTHTRPPTSTPTPTATVTPTTKAATPTPVSTSTIPPTWTLTPTPVIVPPGIAADLLGTWSGTARNDTAGARKDVRIKIEVVSNQVKVTDLNGNLLKESSVIVTLGSTRAFYYNKTTGNANENFTLNSLAPGGLAGLYTRTTLTFPPQIEAFAVELTKDS